MSRLVLAAVLLLAIAVSSRAQHPGEANSRSGKREAITVTGTIRTDPTQDDLTVLLERANGASTLQLVGKIGLKHLEELEGQTVSIVGWHTDPVVLGDGTRREAFWTIKLVDGEPSSTTVARDSEREKAPSARDSTSAEPVAAPPPGGPARHAEESGFVKLAAATGRLLVIRYYATQTAELPPPNQAAPERRASLEIRGATMEDVASGREFRGVYIYRRGPGASATSCQTMDASEVAALVRALRAMLGRQGELESSSLPEVTVAYDTQALLTYMVSHRRGERTVFAIVEPTNDDLTRTRAVPRESAHRFGLGAGARRYEFALEGAKALADALEAILKPAADALRGQ